MSVQMENIYGLISLGAAGSGTMFHFHQDSWCGVMFGTKRWFLYPPSRTVPAAKNGYTAMGWTESVYPNLPAENKPIECVQHAGEILYLPESTFHSTLNIGDTIAVIIMKKEAGSDAGKLLDRAIDLKHMKNQPDVNMSEVTEKLLHTLYKLHELYPENIEVLLELALEHRHSGHIRTVTELLLKIIDLDPTSVIGHIALGELLNERKQYQKAEAALVRACSLQPGNWGAHYLYGQFLSGRGRFAEAVPFFKKLTELRPDIQDGWVFLQESQESAGDTEGARATQRTMEHLPQGHR